jgi:hypothetical protein
MKVLMVVRQFINENLKVLKKLKLNKMISVPVSVGELIDKLSILQVKKTKISDPEKLSYVKKEFELLYNLSAEYLNDMEVENLFHMLVTTNTNLWEIEDKLRVLEQSNKFEEEFIDLARKVYFTNDERFEYKNQINSLTSSEIREVKEYVNYKNKN